MVLNGRYILLATLLFLFSCFVARQAALFIRHASDAVFFFLQSAIGAFRETKRSGRILTRTTVGTQKLSRVSSSDCASAWTCTAWLKTSLKWLQVFYCYLVCQKFPVRNSSTCKHNNIYESIIKLPLVVRLMYSTVWFTTRWRAAGVFISKLKPEFSTYKTSWT